MDSSNVENQSNIPATVLRVERETAFYHEEPPPPYTATNTRVTGQPIIHQTIIIQAPLKENPMLYECSTCRETVFTKVRYVNSQRTHLIAGFICGLTVWCMLCCLAAIPYIMPSFKKAEHYCPICNRYLGCYTKI
ncbi:lipopolysaccharide-induced tumor necrosis factor-alpha factor homolog [Achroia grisella]|uniref:lipopolysaccharide-induced tumor necrosis factor-alpha factor homolog n=1 Tax=Achroia grisella TaxID=688607 RepID=UPI0027D2FF43|nr:lipopolysaccharide-induced tumor necrosis factor-alpha factor homolog [Achroia grisella]